MIWLFAILSFLVQDDPLVVTVDTGKAMTGLVDPQLAGPFLFFDAKSKPVLQEVALITVETTWQTVTVEAFDRELNTVDVPMIKSNTGYQQYAISTPGKTRVRVEASKIDGDPVALSRVVENVIVELGVVPQPPDIDPTPKPPTPDPAPTPIAELTLLFLVETADLPTMGTLQREIFYSQPMRDWLTQNSEWRSYDNDTIFYKCTTKFCKLFGESKHVGETPWLIIADGYELKWQGPVPATAEETKALIRKVSGRG